MKHWLLSAGLLAFPSVVALAENEIGFVEKFALSPERERVLEQLVPGTEEYFYYHALHYQTSGQKPQLKALLKQWADRFPSSGQRQIIENREALLNYDADPAATAALLKERLNLQLDHEPETPEIEATIPSALDPKLISAAAFRERALEVSRDDLSAFSARALAELIRTKTELTPAQRRSLLAKVTLPDIPGLLELIGQDLRARESRGFGEFPIHKLLLPEQLDELAKKNLALYDSGVFVQVRLNQMRPGPETDAEFDRAARTAWLDRLWTFVKQLGGNFNSLKANILFHQLELDRAQGKYDRARFIDYLKLPRPGSSEVNPTYLRRFSSGNNVDFSADSDVVPGGPIGSDEWLVRDYLLHFFTEDKSWEPFATYLRDTYLKALFAEAKLAAGAGSPNDWASLLTPLALQALKDRVEIEWSPTNQQFFPPASDVSLGVIVKNAPKLIVRLYELNTLTWFLTQNRQLNTDVNLDGLVANIEKTLAFDDAGARGPFRRTLRTLALPELAGKRGAWMVEVIGGGKSSRALVRKGQYEVLQESGPAGDLLTVVDENRAVVPDAVVWLEGRRYTPDEKLKRISVPFTQQAGRKPIVVATPTGDFASLTSFEHSAEKYELTARFHIAREQLIAGQSAKLGVRALLRQGGTPLPLDLLEEPRLKIETTLLGNLTSSREITAAEGLKLDAAKDFITEFAVPERLEGLAITLSGKIPQISKGGEKVEFTETFSYPVNGQIRESATYAGYVTRAEGKYFLELRGRNGEPIRRSPVKLDIHHRDFTAEIAVELRTDEAGRIDLGALEGIARFRAELANDGNLSWETPRDGERFPVSLHLAAGEPLSIPWSLPGALRRQDVSFFEGRADVNLADRFAALTLKDGALRAETLAPGDYLLITPEWRVPVHVSAGKSVGGWLVSPVRALESSGLAPVRIVSVREEAEALVVQLGDVNPFTRLSVVGARFLQNDPWDLKELATFDPPSLAETTFARRPNIFVSGRNLGDEYRYILERRFSKIFPGNLLPRPSLLLAPWETRATDVSAQTMERGEAAVAGRGDLEAKAKRKTEADDDMAKKVMMVPGAGTPGDLDYDFLASTAPVVYNLVPDERGMVRIARAALGNSPLVQIYAEDLSSASWRYLTLKEPATALRDRRLSKALDPKQAVTQKRQVTAIPAGGTWSGAAGSDYQVYDSLNRVFGFYRGAFKSAEVDVFTFLLRWPQLSDDEKRAKYTEFASHEVNFFLSRKDPAFFKAVIQPFLKNKKERTFMDDYLLEADLARYLTPWNYGQLNGGERALLAQRLAAERAGIARDLRDTLDTVPPNPEAEKRAFDLALGGVLDEMPPPPPANLGIAVEDAPKNGAGRRRGPMAQPSLAMPATPAPMAPMAAAAKPMPEMMADMSEGTAARRMKNLNYNTAGGGGFAGKDARQEVARLRAEARPFFRKIGLTKEFAESNYYHVRHLPPGSDFNAPVPLIPLWRDYAEWDGQGPFLSAHFHQLAGTRAELIFALAVLDLPFTSAKQNLRVEGGKVILTAASPLLVVHQEVVAVEKPADAADTVMVGENFVRADDPVRQEGNEEFDKFVTEEFLSGVVYTGKAVVTNTSSTPQWLDVLLQIPEGAIGVEGTRATGSERLHCEAYTTATLEYHFYFPEPRAEPFLHHPAQVSREGKLLASATPRTFKVVGKLSKVDETSWDYLSQHGTDAQVLAYLESHNLRLTDFTEIAWRARARVDFFRQLVALMEKRHLYEEHIYAYGVLHREKASMRELLLHRTDFIQQCGPWLRSSLLEIDPINLRTYEHLEYAPLINQRAHRLGAEPKIPNAIFRGQYQTLLHVLACKPELDATDRLSLTYYLFLQDRVEEALAQLKLVKPEGLTTRLQYDYFRCYAALYEENAAEARGLAAQYVDHGVDRWRRLFQGVVAQLDEIDGRNAAALKAVPGADGGQRELDQAKLASTEPGFEFKIEKGQIALTWNRLPEVTVNYYRMDPELLFSTSPFATDDPTRFAIVRPAFSQKQALPERESHLAIALPEQFQRTNLLIEIVAAGQRKVQAYHANSLRLNVVENYGRIDIRDDTTGKPLPRAYVKVYARLKGGTVRYFKDGYSDLRGIFDYASLNTGTGGGPIPYPATPTATGDLQMLRPQELGEVEKLAILVLTDQHGSTVREVNPPAE